MERERNASERRAGSQLNRGSKREKEVREKKLDRLMSERTAKQNIFL